MAALHRPFEYRLPTLTAQIAADRQRFERRYGVTNLTEVRTYGYLPGPITATPPATSMDLKALVGRRGRPGCLTLARREVTPDSADRTPFVLAESLANIAWLRSSTYPEVRTAVAEWAGCMKVHGYSVTNPLQSGMPAGRTVPAPGEVQQAVADIHCKQATRLVERWSATEAEVAALLVRQYRSELDHEQRKIVSAVAHADLVLHRQSTYG